MKAAMGATAGAQPWAEIGLTVAVGVSGLALGGANVTVVLVVTFWLALCGVFSANVLRKVPAPAMVFAGLGAYTLLQAVPLPVSLLQWASPASADAWSRSLEPFGERVTIGSLSLDPGATFVEAAKWFSYAVAFSMAAASAKRRGARAAVGIVFSSALAVALATLGHSLVGASSVFGVYEPILGTAPERIGPILNSNCLAGYLTIGTLCGAGLALAAKSTAKRWLWAAGSAFIASLAILTGSRGGLVVLVIGCVAVALIARKASASEHTSRRTTWADRAGIAAVPITAVVFAALGQQDYWTQISQRDLSKLKMGAWVLPMIRDFGWFGVGRGAFESVFPFYKLTPDNLTYSHPENIVAQWLAEWGLPVGIVAFASLFWLLRPSRVGFGRHPLTSAALVGVAAVVVQNLADFGLELLGPMLATVVVLGACWGQARRKNSSSSVAPTTLKSAFGPIIVGLLLLSVALGYARGRWPVAIERRALHAKYAGLERHDSGAARSLLVDLHAAMQRHPAEPYFSRVGALLALRDNRMEPLRWLSRSLDRSLVDSRSHWILAQALHSHGYTAQALLEARLSVEYDADLAIVVGTTVASWTQSFEELARTAPRGRSGTEVLLAIANSRTPVQTATLRETLIRRAIAGDPTFAAARRALAEELLSQLLGGKCAGEARNRCETSIAEEAAVLRRLVPQSPWSCDILSRLYASTNRLEEVEELLTAQSALLEPTNRTRCLQSLLAAALTRPDRRSTVSRAADALAKAACATGSECENSLIRAGDAMVQLKNWPEAMLYFQRAVRLEPSVPSLLKLAEAAHSNGQPGLAAHALDQASARGDLDDHLRAAVLARRATLRAPPPPARQEVDQLNTTP